MDVSTENCEDDLNLQFMVAAQQGNIDRLDEILQSGIDINSQDLMYSETAVVGACRYGHTDVVQFLISRGADVNVRTKNGCTALHVAVINSQVPCLQFLLSWTNIQKDVQHEMGMTPIMLAAHRGLHREIRMLAQHGCKLDIVNARGQAAVHLTQLPYRGHVGNMDGFRCLKEIMSFGVDIDVQDNLGMTPLHYAIKSGNFQSVKWLISENCNLNAIADSQNLKKSGDPSQILPLPLTPLNFAVYFFNVCVVKLLLDCGCAKLGCTKTISYSEKHQEIHALLSSSFWAPSSLKTYSRIIIRRALGRQLKTNINCLGLPTVLREFVLYEKELQKISPCAQCNS